MHLGSVLRRMLHLWGAPGCSMQCMDMTGSKHTFSKTALLENSIDKIG